MTNKTELTTVSPELKSAVDKLLALKASVDEIGLNCQQIKVVDENTLSICQQNLSKANSLATDIEAKRKAMKEPHLDACKLIDSTAKSLTEELQKGISHTKAEVAGWEAKKQAEEADKQKAITAELAEKQKALEAEEKRKTDILNYINNKARVTLQKMYTDCTSAEICEAKIKTIEAQYKPREFFAEFADMAYELRDNYLSFIRTKRDQFLNLNNLSESEKQLELDRQQLNAEKAALAIREAQVQKERAAEAQRLELEQQAKEEKEKLENEAMLTKTRGVRYTWGYEVTDITMVQRALLTVNHDAVMDYIKENKDTWKEAGITKTAINGIQFFKKPIVVA